MWAGMRCKEVERVWSKELERVWRAKGRERRGREREGEGEGKGYIWRVCVWAGGQRVRE